MKKAILFTFLLLLSVIFTPFFQSYVLAIEDNQFQPTTIYPEEIIDYVDLNNISTFAINQDYIVYTLDKSKLTIYQIETRQFYYIDNFNNINKIKFLNSTIIVGDNNGINVIDNYISANPQISKLNEIIVTNSKAIDIYTSNNYMYIGTINNNTFNLYKYELNEKEVSLIKSIESPYLENAYMIAINDYNAYVVYKTNNSEKFSTGLCIFNLKSTNTSAIIKDPFKVNASVLDTFIYNDVEYLVTFTNENLFLLSNDASDLSNIHIANDGDLETNNFPIFNITDINFFDNKIYVSDVEFKTIQTFNILKTDNSTNLMSDSIILGSKGFDKGRFDNVNDIYIQGDTIFTSDTGNNRIHYLLNNKSYFIQIDEANANIHSVTTDKNNDIYFVKNDLTKSTLVKYRFSENSYILDSQYSQVNTENIGFVSDICITNTNNVFLLDYTNNNLLFLSGNGLVIRKNLSILLNNNSQIEYIKSIDKLIILNNEILYCLNTNGEIISQKEIIDTTCITVDFDKFYAITNDKIILLKFDVNNNTIIEEKSIQIENLSNYKAFCFDIINRKMVAFDKVRNCLVEFTCNINQNPFLFSDITINEPLTVEPLPLKIINQSLIYEYPYELGNFYNTENNISMCVGIEEYNDYYRILFENNDSLQCGFIPKTSTEVQPIIYNPIKVITTNQIVPVYKYPTLLSYNSERLIINNLNINTKIILTSVYPVSLDTKTFYVYKNNNEIGFIFNADVVLDESNNIQNLNTENAKIKLIGQDSISLLKDDKTTEIIKLKNNDRIYVEKYDKNSEYTKIIFKDKDLNTYEGYIKTEYIEMDKLDNFKIVLIIIIIVSIILLALIVTTYIVIKKKNK